MPKALPSGHYVGVLRVFLASGSPRRLWLLREAGVDTVVATAPCDERCRSGENVIAYTGRLAVAKLEAARAAHGASQHSKNKVRRPWLAADTVVWFPPDGAPLGKPANPTQARALLERLTAGVPHSVTTAWALAWDTAPPQVHHTTTRVCMRHVEPAELDTYLAGDEWTDKAGGYGIQGTAASWVTSIEGSYTNVVGLPVAQVIEQIMKRGDP